MAGALDAGVIADAAIALADSEGADAVSMRRVGAALGVSGMALYRHVADRDQLIVRMIGRVAAALPEVVRSTDGWRQTLKQFAGAEWVAFVRHPWLADVAVSPTRLVDATSAAETELILERLVAAGCTPERSFDVFVATTALVIGIARVTLTSAAERPTDYASGPDRPERESLAARFRAQPLDAARGSRLLEASLAAFFDGVEASLDTSRRKDNS